MLIDPDKLYANTDEALDAIAPASTRAHWRHEGRGPKFLKIGPKVFYRGGDLREWLDSCLVEPRAA